MKKSSIIYLLIITLLSIIIGLTVNHCKSISKAESDTIVKVYYDTVYHTIFKVVEKPKPYKVQTIKHDTIYQDKDTTISLSYERKWHKDTIFFTENDTAIIETTIVGINPSIERINALLKKRQINQTIEKTIKEKKKSKLFIVPTVGVGYGLFNKKPDLYIGVGIGYQF